MPFGRRAELEIFYEGTNVTTPINEYSTSFTYTDVASGKSDSVTIDMQDIQKEWIGAWMPVKGDRVRASILLHDWEAEGNEQRIDCGEFLLDDMSFGGRPMHASIGGVSIPRDEPFSNQKRTKTWESITLRQIAQEIAERANISLYYEADEISIEIDEQNEETDCSFLYSRCVDYGLAMKVYENKIILFEEERYENRPSVRTIGEEEMTKWSYNTTMAGTYTGASMKYIDPNNNQEYMVTVGGGNRILELNESTDSIQDAEKKAISRLNNENKKAVTLGITVMADSRLTAGSCVEITGLEKANGKYYIDQISLSKGGGQECSMNLTMHLVVPRIKTVSIGAIEQEIKDNTENGSSYVTAAGDTLWDIAKRFYGKGTEYERIYQANKDLIENTAKDRGKRNSSNGHWIFPGTSLIIPGKEQ